VIRIMTKLNKKVKRGGKRFSRASQRSFEVEICAVEGILISMISSVRAMANTQSQKASNREFGFVCDMFF